MSFDSTPNAPTPRIGRDHDADATLPTTEDRALWRTATVAPEEASHDGAVSGPKPQAFVERSDDGGAGSSKPRAPAEAGGSRARGEVAPHPGDAVASAAARYRIQEVIGVGGMGEVRLCHDETIGRDVAYKSLLGEREASARAGWRFLREARVQGQLEHPSIVPVYDLGAAPDGRLFFTMRRVRGHTLEAVIDALARGEPARVASHSRRKLLDAFARVCLAVDYAHARGVLHRDLKPSNIMLGDFGEVYVLDWGVAKLVAEHATAAPVVDAGADGRGQGSTVGTPGYMSPEQILGLGDSQDARTDVYALGAILFEILTLRRLHGGDSIEALAASTVQPSPRGQFADADGVPPELAALCEHAVAFDRAKRCPSARAMASMVERYLDGDRDVERRRALAGERVAAAAAAFARAASEPDAGAAQADAVREVTAALALDPENMDARRLLMRLFVEVPSRLPPGVEAEREAATHRDRRQYLRFGMVGVASWMLMPPLMMAMGIRAWAPVLLTSALCGAAVLYALWVFRRREVTVGRIHVVSALVLATVASASCFMGPFVIVPQTAAVVTLYIALLHRRSRQRWAVIAMGTLAVTIPFVVELLGVLPPAFAFVDGNVVLFGRALQLAPQTTLPLLLYSCITSVALPAALLSSVRDALSTAERRLFLQAWHLRQLLPE